MKGIFWALVTAVFWGIAPLFEKTGLERVEPMVVVLIRCILLITVLTSVLSWQGKLQTLLQVDTYSLIFILLGGLFSAVLAQVTYFYALKHGQASQIIPLVCVYPLITVLLSVLFLGEKFTFDKIVGTCLVILGIFFLR